MTDQPLSSGLLDQFDAAYAVVTADRMLQYRVAAVGATWLGPSWLLDLL